MAVATQDTDGTEQSLFPSELAITNDVLFETIQILNASFNANGRSTVNTTVSLSSFPKYFTVCTMYYIVFIIVVLYVHHTIIEHVLYLIKKQSVHFISQLNNVHNIILSIADTLSILVISLDGIVSSMIS